MKVAFGMKAHSGWAATVVLGKTDGAYVIIDRQRIELVDEPWQKQPYHAAEGLAPEEARIRVKRGIEAAQKRAVKEIRAMLTRENNRKNEVAGCAVLVANPMPDWTVDEILAVHFRMHKAEGVLFRETLLKAAESCGLKAIAAAEKHLMNAAKQVVGKSEANVMRQLLSLGKAAGPPWGKDQKDSALAAMIALQ